MTNAQEPSEAPTPPVDVPASALSEAALAGIIEQFVLREGTDYGAHEADYSTKLKQVRRQIETGEVKIVFDPNTESVTLLTRKEWAQRQP